MWLLGIGAGDLGPKLGFSLRVEDDLGSLANSTQDKKKELQELEEVPFIVGLRE